MFCSGCGKGLSEGAKFCAACGVQVAAVVQTNIEVSRTTETSFLKNAYDSASHSIIDAASAAKNFGGKVAVHVGDLNGDGKVDADDYKIAADKAKQIVSAASDEAVKLGKSAMQSDLVKDAVAGAVVGGAIASIVPVIGTVAGAAVGASLGAYKNFTKN